MGEDKTPWSAQVKRLCTWFRWPKFSRPPVKSFRQMSGFGVKQPLKLLFCSKTKRPLLADSADSADLPEAAKLGYENVAK